MEDKCFCHINEYKVKDADARIEIENIKQQLANGGSGADLSSYHLYYMEFLNNKEVDKPKFSEVITKMWTDGSRYNGLILNNNLSVGKYEICTNETNIIDPWGGRPNNIYFSCLSLNAQNNMVQIRRLTINGSWENDVFTCSGYSMSSITNIKNVDISLYLSKSNTTEYTPTGSYHPATKKYVDDAIANVESGGGSGGVSEDTVNNLISNAISEEVTNRNTAITNAINQEVTNRDSAITNAINQEVTNRNNAIGSAITNNDLANKTYVDTKVGSIKHSNLETVLYDNPSGTTDGITLTDSVANYNYIEIYFKHANNDDWDTKVIHNPNGKKTSLNLIHAYLSVSNENKMYYEFMSRSIIFNGNQITNSTCGSMNFIKDKGFNSINDTNNSVAIYRVIGWN